MTAAKRRTMKKANKATPDYPAQTGIEAARAYCAILLITRIPKISYQCLVLRELWRLIPPPERRAFRRQFPLFFAASSNAGAR